ncbi:hypothetical protein [Adlercreutzia sp. ZJ154]|uniref:hypothetical protein n=1 Tax=Adlercreutzia sp. ZJ154 TaxID=2709790 RepID=UPI0013EB5D21|nr:hypothetical protein [Adlercreutzia sp. ZJ154]
MSENLEQQKSGWYAMVTKPGFAYDVLALVRAAAAKSGVAVECFVPECRVVDGRGASSVAERRELAPVCLVKLNDSPDGLLNEMKKTSALRRFAGRKAEFLPLRSEDAAWIDENAAPEGHGRVFDMSEGHIENGSVTVTSGPLVGRENWIDKISHRKKRARLHIDMFGSAMDVEMGLKLVGKKAHS